MIAQPILTTPAAAKSPSAPHVPQPANSNGFLSLLSATDPTLMDLAQNTGALPTSAGLPANTNKTAKTNDAPTAATAPASNIAPPAMPAASPTPVLPPASVPSATDNQLSINGAAIPSNAILPAPTAAAAAQNAAAASAQTLAAIGNQAAPNATNAATDTGSGNNANGNSTAFGADQVNARVVAAAPIFASQPPAAMASVPPHLLDAATPHPQPGLPLGTTVGDVPQKTSSAASAAPAAPAAASSTPGATPAPQLSLNHAAASDQGGSFGTAGNNVSAAAPTTDTAATNNGADASTAGSTPLPTQPNAPLAAPVQADAAVHTAVPYLPVGEQVALNLKQALNADNNEIRIQLKPASLGTIDVKLNLTQDGRVSAVISADRSDTLNILKQDSGTLQQALRDAGLNADSNSLSFGLRGDAQSFAQNSFQGSGHQSGSGVYRNAAVASFASAAVTPSPLRFHSGTVDIEV